MFTTKTIEPQPDDSIPLETLGQNQQQEIIPPNPNLLDDNIENGN